jgi:hypothetical protein
VAQYRPPGTAASTGGGGERAGGRQIVLGNSPSYELHQVANGLPWEHGDEVLVIEGDYPVTVLPWQHLTRQYRPLADPVLPDQVQHPRERRGPPLTNGQNMRTPQAEP